MCVSVCVINDEASYVSSPFSSSKLGLGNLVSPSHTRTQTHTTLTPTHITSGNLCTPKCKYTRTHTHNTHAHTHYLWQHVTHTRATTHTTHTLFWATCINTTCCVYVHYIYIYVIYIYTSTYIHTLTQYLGQHVQARRAVYIYNIHIYDIHIHKHIHTHTHTIPWATCASTSTAAQFAWGRSKARPSSTCLQQFCVSVRALQCVAVCCKVLQCVAVCCSVLQCVAVCCMQSSPFFYCTTNVLHYPLICATRRTHTCFIFERVTSHTIPTYMIITSLSTHSTVLSYKCTNTYVQYKTTIQTRLPNKLVCLFIFTYV